VAFEVTLPDTENGRDAYENCRLGNLKGGSFGFVVRDDDWSQDSQGNLTRVIKDVQCFEVTLTAFPAYDKTSVAISRSARAKLRSKRDDDPCNPNSESYDPDSCDDLDINMGSDDEDGDDTDWSDRSASERCAYRCRRCAAHSNEGIQEDDPDARSKRFTKKDPKLSDAEYAKVEATRCSHRCSECRAIGHGYPTAVAEDDEDARAAKHLLSLRSR
jgi:hypothetical protein